jgi:hypothetical protein
MSVNTYSKEFLLAAFKIIENPPDAELWHCPDSIVVSQVSQQPLAFSPLTQHEKNVTLYIHSRRI